MEKFMIGQRVIISGVICKVVKPEHNNSNGVWAFNPANGYASCYAFDNVKPLPNGQL